MSLAVAATPAGRYVVDDGEGRTLVLVDAGEVRALARALLAALPRERPEGVVCDLTFPGEPQVKTRPRVSFVRGVPHVFTTSGPHEKALAQFLRYRNRRPSEAELDVTVGFSRSTRQRADLDNLLKLLLDAGNGTLWVDDSQVRRVEAVVERGVGARDACTRVRVRELLMENPWPWARAAA